jgi:hypothetical protein
MSQDTQNLDELVTPDQLAYIMAILDIFDEAEARKVKKDEQGPDKL